MIYIDVTQLVHWGGNLTGIPRVMNELSIRFAEKSDIKFLSWDPTSCDYKIVDIKKTLERRGKEIFFITQSGETLSSSTNKPVLFKIARRVNERYITLPTKVLSLLDGPAAEADVPRLDKGDKLVVLWGEQSSENFIKKLKSLHLDGIDIIQVSYDLLPLVTPQYSDHSTKSMEVYTKSIFPLCSLVLSISESTKRDIENWMRERGLNIPRVEVFRLGDDFKSTKTKEPLNISNKPGSFILSVGTIEARKNHTLLYYTYKNASEKGIDLPNLFIVGRQGWKAGDIFSLITIDPEVNKKITILNNISDEELAWLYTNCLFSVYPSFYEGWGLPIAESIFYGSPCIASKTSSMPEIAGNLIEYFSPTSTEECLDLMVKYSSKKHLTVAKNKLGKYKSTTWDQTFDQVNSFIMEKV